MDINMVALGIEGDGAWTVTIVNGYTVSEGASYDGSMTFVGLCEQDIVIDILGCTDEKLVTITMLLLQTMAHVSTTMNVVNVAEIIVHVLAVLILKHVIMTKKQ